MSDKPPLSELYSTPIDTEDGKTISDDEIIVIDAHTKEAVSPHPQYNKPSLNSDDLKLIVELLDDIGKQERAVQMEIEYQHLIENDSYTPRFTAIDLNDIIAALALIKTKCIYEEDMEGALAIKRIGRVIDESVDTILAESAQWQELTGLRPSNRDDSIEYINPIDVLVERQLLSFVDTHGNRLDSDEAYDSRGSILIQRD